jgi:hypothetical protein
VPLSLSKKRGSGNGNESRGTVMATARIASLTSPTHLTTATPGLSPSTSPSQTGFRVQYIVLVACWQTTEQAHPIYHSARPLGPAAVL